MLFQLWLVEQLSYWEQSYLRKGAKDQYAPFLKSRQIANTFLALESRMAPNPAGPKQEHNGGHQAISQILKVIHKVNFLV